MSAPPAKAEPVLSEQRAQELIEEFEVEARTRQLRGAWGTVVTVGGIAVAILALYYATAGAPVPFTQIPLVPNITLFGLNITTLQIYSLLFLGAALSLTFLHYPAIRRWRARVHPTDVLLVVASVAIVAYVLAQFDEVIYRAVSPTPGDFVFGLTAVLLVLEATRRTVGWHLAALVVVFLAYAYFGNILPEAIRHRGFDLDDIVAQQYISLDGMLGLIYVAGSYIILFTIYGAVLERSGASRFFIDLAFALTGRRRSGAGRTVTIASFLLGTVSGSGVATTVTLGSIAYPMLKKSGYDKETAGAILSAGGIGAILSPPVLGAAAFIMAELLRLPYLDVLLMACMPTVLYYLSVLIMIELDARKLGTRSVDVHAPAVGQLLRTYWFHLTSLVAIVALMVLGLSAFLAVFWAIVFAILVSFAHRETALSPRKILASLADGTRGVLSVATTIAAAGMIVGVLLQTGLGLKASNLIVAIGQGNFLLTLVLCAFVLWILGLSLPITASYLVAVPVIAPALINGLGIPAPAAHMFIFYYAVLSEVSPPVALAPFAAAALTGGNPYRTMLITWKYALPAFIVPFMFTQPDGLALLWRGDSLGEVVVASISAAVGIVALVGGVGGYLLRSTTWPERVLLVTAGMLLLAPGALADAIGIAAFAVALGLQLARRARERLGTAAGSVR